MRPRLILFVLTLLALDEPDNGEGEEEDNWDDDMEKCASSVKQTLLMMLRDLSSLQALKFCEQ